MAWANLYPGVYYGLGQFIPPQAKICPHDINHVISSDERYTHDLLNFSTSLGHGRICRGQGVPLHRGLHQLAASTNSSNTLYRLITVSCIGLLAQPSLFV